MKIVRADLEDPHHQTSLMEMVEAFSADPFGAGRPLPESARAGLIDGLREHPTTLVFLAFEAEAPIGMAICFRSFSTFAARPVVNSMTSSQARRRAAAAYRARSWTPSRPRGPRRDRDADHRPGGRKRRRRRKDVHREPPRPLLRFTFRKGAKENQDPFVRTYRTVNLSAAPAERSTSSRCRTLPGGSPDHRRIFGRALPSQARRPDHP